MTVRVPYNVLNDRSIDLKMLSRFIMLKRCYVNSTVYSYNASSFAARLSNMGISISVSTLRRWVKSFINLGWARIDANGSLKFAKLTNLTTKESKRGFSISFHGVKDVLKALYFELLNAKSRQCSFASALNAAFGRNVSFKQEKVSKGLLKNLKHGPVNGKQTLKISYDGLAKLFRTSRATAMRLVNSFEQITKQTNSKAICKGSQKMLKYALNQGTWQFKGYIYKREMNVYSF